MSNYEKETVAGNVKKIHYICGGNGLYEKDKNIHEPIDLPILFCSGSNKE
jgi:hypothetical protein